MDSISDFLIDFERLEVFFLWIYVFRVFYVLGFVLWFGNVILDRIEF